VNRVVCAGPIQRSCEDSWCDIVFRCTCLPNVDRDLSTRPGDALQTGVVDGASGDIVDLSSPDNMAPDIRCINPVSTVGTCEGALPNATLDRVGYQANTANRGASHNVMVLIDGSGSVTGLIRDRMSQNDPDGCKEERVPSSFPPNFLELASHRSSFRLGVPNACLCAVAFIRTCSDGVASDAVEICASVRGDEELECAAG